MSRKTGIFGLCLAAPVAIAMLVASATYAWALTIDVTCGGETVGTVTVNAQGAGKGISGGFTSTTGDPPTLAAAAAACDETQFNWYQIVTADNGKAKNAAGMFLMAPYVDPPPGGYSDQWADNLPWYYDMTNPPADAMNVDPDLSLSANTTADTLSFSDNPMSSGNITFTTWLVSLNANGSLQSFDVGFTWQYDTGTNTVTMLSEYLEGPTDGQYQDLIGGFASTVPEPATWVLMIFGFAGMFVLRRGVGGIA
jgi:hypothetical protein